MVKIERHSLSALFSAVKNGVSTQSDLDRSNYAQLWLNKSTVLLFIKEQRRPPEYLVASQSGGMCILHTHCAKSVIVIVHDKLLYDSLSISRSANSDDDTAPYRYIH